MSSSTAHLDLGRADYKTVLDLQRKLHSRRCAGEIGDLVLTVEHDPVFTIGRTGSTDHLLVDRERLEQEGISLCEVERGGDITYHGPEQLVVYPIVDLRARGRDLKRFIADLEETAIRTVRRWEIEANRRATYPGVWVGSRKIASVGVYVKRWVTRHGLALNIDVDPAHFAMIRPCGLDIETVSIATLSDRPAAFDRVRSDLLNEMADVFGWTFRETVPEEFVP